MIKKTLVFLYVVVVAVMAAATFAERLYGVNVYAQWWFSLLWALLAAVSIVYFLSRRVHRLSVVVLHLSFPVILLGALLTHLYASQGILHLRQGETSLVYMTEDGVNHALPFSVTLDTFQVIYHPGTMAAADYESHLTIRVDGKERKETVSMNNICTVAGIRLYQSSYDDDGRGSVLAVNSDPWGIPITYTGYALLFVGLVWMLIDPKGQYRQLLRSPLLRRGALVLMLPLMSIAQVMAAPTTVSRETASKLGQLNMLYNDRICPLQTYAVDFTKKIYGKPRYEGLTAEQVLAGFLFYADEWNAEPIVKMKGSELRQQLHLGSYASVHDFFDNGYQLGPLIQAYYHGHQQEALYKQASQMDDRLSVVVKLQQGLTLKVFPYTDQQGITSWYGPMDQPDTLAIPQENRLLMSSYFNLLYGALADGDEALANEYLDRLLDYQHQNGGTSIPSDLRLKAERTYNQIPFATILFMVNLTTGILSFLLLLLWPRPWTFRVFYGIMLLSCLALTCCLALRWIVSGNVPMSNGYETMLLMAWMLELITLCLQHRFRILLTFGFLLSGFFLLVSHISQMDPQIGHLMPVLRSPLLTLHVSIIMIAFALLSLTFISGITAFIFHCTGRQAQIESLAVLSRVFLYPALTTLGFGIFIGAIWANISWGTYWSWDPKEVWALITFMVYAVVVHTQSFRCFQRPLVYHLYVTLSFLTILMTYFGVNYFLGGMHSYA